MLTPHSRAITAAWIVLTVVASGCGGAYRASQVQTIPLEQREKVIYKNFWLKASVGVLTTESEVQEGFLKAKLKLKNMTSSLINAEIKVKFLDQGGYELNDTWGWTPLPLESGEIKSIQRTAPSKGATDYRVLIKLAGEED
jgi:uncharacterized protein YcfL